MNNLTMFILCLFVYVTTILYIAAKDASYLKSFLLCAIGYVCLFVLVAANDWFLTLANPYTLGFLLPLLFIISIVSLLFILFTKNNLVTKSNTIIHFSILIISIICFSVLYLFIGTRYSFADALYFSFNIPFNNDFIEDYSIVDIIDEGNKEHLYSLYFFIGICIQIHSILSFCFSMIYFIKKKIGIGLVLFLTWIFSLAIIYLLAIFDLMRP